MRIILHKLTMKDNPSFEEEIVLVLSHDLYSLLGKQNVQAKKVY